MSKFTDKIRRLHRSRVRALDEAEKREAEDRVFLAEDAVETDADPRRRPGSAEGSESIQSNAAGFESLGAHREDDVWVLERRFDAAHAHGRYSLAEVLEVELPLSVDDQLHLFSGGTEVDQLGFFDIETSGLSETSRAYCIGLGCWKDGDFIVRQYLMADESDEGAVLSKFARDLEELRGLVSFNGRTFDVPRVRGRMAHHAVDSALETLEHVDLLRVARRFFPRRKDLGLETLERTLTLFHRVDDVPGSEAPTRWENYLKMGRVSVSGLEPVFDHNRLDILSLATLMVHLSQLVGVDMSTAEPSDDPRRARRTEAAARREYDAPSRKSRKAEDSELTKKLQKTYRLRKGRVVRRRPEKRMASSEIVKPMRIVRDDERPVSHAEVGDKLGRLRREAAGHLEAHRFDAAVPLLHEMIALSPHNPYPIAQLARYYRLVGDEALAALFEERLEGLAPY